MISIDDTNFIPVYTKAKIQCLLGEAENCLGHSEDALRNMVEAAYYFGYYIPRSSFLAGLQVFLVNTKRRLSRFAPMFQSRIIEADQTKFYNEASYCLSKLFEIYKQMDDWGLANLAAIQSLFSAQKGRDDICRMCTAYTNMLEVALHYGNLYNCKQMENEALRECEAVFQISEMDEQTFQAVGLLYTMCFNTKLLRGKLSPALDLGLAALQICYRLKSRQYRMLIAPMLLQTHILMWKIPEATELLSELRVSWARDANRSASAWYYAICMDLMLEAGVSVEKYDTCKHYSDELKASRVIFMDRNAMQRLLVGMWLWCVRNNQREEASRWEKILMKHEVKCASTVPSVLFCLKLLECLLLNAVFHIDSANNDGFSSCINEAKSLITKIKDAVVVAKFGEPR